MSLSTRDHAQDGGLPRDVAIRLDRVSKAFKMYDRPFNFLIEAVTGRPSHREKFVLNDISLTINRGEIVGIIGRNGAGKSTLLKIIAGTLTTTHGSVAVGGRVSAILELGTGFNSNYSGRDNVIMSALMRGMSERDVLAKFDSIVRFAGLEDVIDEPFHTYSSGMQARLAFAAATSVNADVLVIDEALAAGDIRFAAKSLRRVHEICKSGITALFVSHVTYHVMQLCSRVVWIDDGRIRMDGDPLEVVRAYEYEMHAAIARDQGLESRPSMEEVLGKRTPIAREPKPTPDASNPNLSAVVELVRAANDTGMAELPSARLDERAKPGSDPCGTLPSERAEERLAGSGVPEMNSVEASVQLGVAAGEKFAEYRDADKLSRFSTGRYRIIDILFLDKHRQRTTAFKYGEPMRVQVTYECLMSNLPRYSCGLAVAFNRISDFEAVMYFNTNYPHSDHELQDYFNVPFRTYVGRTGKIEAVVDPVQLRAGEYYVSIGILPNQPGPHEFYEYLHCQHRVRILANGFDEPSVFYPLVSWTNGPIE
jgi:ABC-type polysaccharide/polyol phosphate transport system ATPase subunit